MLEDVARRVHDELTANGYSPKMHEPENEDGLMTKISEDFRLDLKLSDDAHHAALDKNAARISSERAGR